MKITAIETIQNKNFSNLVWVKTHTDEGITGLGVDLNTSLLDSQDTSKKITTLRDI